MLVRLGVVALLLYLTGCMQAPRRDLYLGADFRFEDITPEQAKQISNGCGGPGTEVMPEFIFRGSCDRHDFYYWVGGSEEDRLRADQQFYEDTKADAWAASSFWNRSRYLTAAFNYYLAVRKWGRLSFHYTTRKRGWENLPRPP